MGALGNKAKIIALLIIALLAVGIFAGTSFSQKAPENDSLATYSVGPTITLSQCESCHTSIDNFKNPDLIFDHWKHFKNGISCATCHIEPAHKGGKTKIPPMEICYSCHKLEHSVQGIAAKGDCKTCHPANFNRLPKNHTGGFIAKTHKSVKGNPLKINGCMLCHTKSQCKSCHDQKKIKSDYSSYSFEFRLQPFKQELQTLTFDKVTTLSQCTACHTNLNANMPEGLIFDHWVHFKNGVKCDTCHQGLIHKSGEITKISMNFCYACHGLGHSSQGLVATENCGKCHTASFNLVPPTHNKDWLKNHKKPANETLFECLTCHQKFFCQNCHTGRKVMPPVLPKSQQRNRHQQAHSQKGLDCTICHSDAFCGKCHKTHVPHSYTFIGEHKQLLKNKPAQKDDCYVCHNQKQFCESCHHPSQERILLNKLTCSRCHDEFNDKFQVLVQEAQVSSDSTVKARLRALVYHQVHFKKNYRCEACHLPGLSRLKNGTFQLCAIEGCHPPGQKKPPSGNVLCIECHKSAPHSMPVSSR